MNRRQTAGYGDSAPAALALPFLVALAACSLLPLVLFPLVLFTLVASIALTRSWCRARSA